MTAQATSPGRGTPGEAGDPARARVLAEDPAIRAAVMDGMTVDDVHAVMDRLGHCCECLRWREQDQKREQEAAARKAVVSRLPNHGQRWTQADLAVLRELWLTDDECARILGRTAGAVESARNVYKIYPGRDVRKDDDQPDRQRALRAYAEQLAARPEAIR